MSFSRAAVGSALLSSLLGLVGLGALAACGGEAFTAAADGGAPPGDAAAQDGGADAPEAGPGFCASQTPPHTFCADFDESNDMRHGWDGLTEGPKTDVHGDSTSVSSPPRSCVIQTTAALSNELGVALLQKDLGRSHQVTFACDVYFESIGSASPATDFAGFVLLTTGMAKFALAASTPDTVVFTETLTPDAGPTQTLPPHKLSTALVLGQWVHIQMTLTMPTTVKSGTITITANGNTVLDEALQIGVVPPDTMLVSLGIYVGNAPTVWKIHYDNVTVDRVP